MSKSETVVFLDDVQFDKGGWRNRNRIACGMGPTWLSVPLKHNGSSKLLIEKEIDNCQDWQTRHLNKLRNAYSNSPNWAEIYDSLELIINNDYVFLVELNIALSLWMLQHLGIEVEIVRSSRLPRYAGDNPSERLAYICQLLDGGTYLTTPKAKNYLESCYFDANNIRIAWVKFDESLRYYQGGDGFIPKLSAIDLMFWNSIESQNNYLTKLTSLE
jgi:hypothetical protein